MSKTGNVVEKWAFFSLTDKSDAPSYARRLLEMGWKIISAGNTCKLLASEGIEVLDLAKLVGGGEILGHKVLSLSRQLYAGLLADALKPEELAELVNLHLPFIDFVYCNFYPMKQAIAEANKMADRANAIALVVNKTDIGGPCMIRGAAKGFRIVVCRKQDMDPILFELETTGDVPRERRQQLRARAEYEVAMYIAASAVFQGDGRFSVFGGEKVISLKGENGPQGPAGLYISDIGDPLSVDKFELVAGSPLSYCNWCDLDRLLQIITHISAGWKSNFSYVPHIAIGVKHGNACGMAINTSAMEAARSMIAGDTRAIFGGFIMTNFKITRHIANAMASMMPGGKARFDGIVAPGFDRDAVKILSRVKGKCRIMENPALEGDGSAKLDTAMRFRQVRGGMLVQGHYGFLLDFKNPEMGIYGEPKVPNSLRLKKDLVLASAVGSTSNSNTITIVKDKMLIGNGVGQQDRVGAAELAIKRAIDAGHQSMLKGAVAYSDSFFPFTDGVEVLIKAGIQAIFSTSGSIHDKDVQDLCVEREVLLYQLPDSLARGFFGH